MISKLEKNLFVILLLVFGGSAEIILPLVQAQQVCTLTTALGVAEEHPLYEGEEGFRLRRGAREASHETITKLRSFISHSSALRASAEWTQLLNHSEVQSALRQNPCLRHVLRTTPIIEVLLRASSGVSQRYSVGEHSGRVFEAYVERQRDLEERNRARIANNGAQRSDAVPIQQHEFFKNLTLLHDIGKGFSAMTRDELEVTFSSPLVYRLLLIMGFSEAEAVLARALIHHHKLLGAVAQAQTSVENGLRVLRSGALSAGVSVPTFYILLENLFVADASSYPNIRRSSFEVLEGGLFPDPDREPAFYLLRGRALQVTPTHSAPAPSQADDGNVAEITDEDTLVEPPAVVVQPGIALPVPHAVSRPPVVMHPAPRPSLRQQVPSATVTPPAGRIDRAIAQGRDIAQWAADGLRSLLSRVHF